MMRLTMGVWDIYFVLELRRKRKTTFWRHLPNYNIVVLFNPTLFEFVTTKEGGFTFYIE